MVYNSRSLAVLQAVSEAIASSVEYKLHRNTVTCYGCGQDIRGNAVRSEWRVLHGVCYTALELAAARELNFPAVSR